jgi:hypothetical protein
MDNDDDVDDRSRRRPPADDDDRPRRRRDEEDDRPRRRRDEDDEYEERPRRRRRDDEDDYDDRPRRRRRRDDEEGDATGGLIPYKNPKALTAYYVGVFSLIPCVGMILAVVAIVLGVLGLKYAKAHPTARGQAHAIVGIVLGTLVILGHVGVVAAAALGKFK